MGSASEDEFELARQRGSRARWRPRPEAEFGENLRDLVGCVGDLHESHGAATARAGHDVGGEHPLQQPRPWVPRRGLGFDVVWRLGQRFGLEYELQLDGLGLLGCGACVNLAID